MALQSRMYKPVPQIEYEPPARLEYDDEIALPHSRLTDELSRRMQLDQVRNVTGVTLFPRVST